MTIPADRLTAILQRAVLLEGHARERFVAGPRSNDVERRGLVDGMLADIGRPAIIERPVSDAAAGRLGDDRETSDSLLSRPDVLQVGAGDAVPW